MYHCFQDLAGSASRDDLTEFDLTIAHLRTKLDSRSQDIGTSSQTGIEPALRRLYNSKRPRYFRGPADTYRRLVRALELIFGKAEIKIVAGHYQFYP
jgi:hypothetical protein